MALLYDIQPSGVNACCTSAYRGLRQGAGQGGMPKKPPATTRPVYRPNCIRAWRKHRGMTIDDLAAATRIDRGNLSKIERAILAWNQDTIERLADALDCSVSDLLFRDPADPVSLWSLRDRATDSEWREISEVAETMLSFRRRQS